MSATVIDLRPPTTTDHEEPGRADRSATPGSSSTDRSG